MIETSSARPPAHRPLPLPLCVQKTNKPVAVVVVPMGIGTVTVPGKKLHALLRTKGRRSLQIRMYVTIPGNHVRLADGLLAVFFRPGIEE